MSNTEEVQQEIIKCSCCHMKYFKCDFEGKRLGQIYKTCKKCRDVATEKRKRLVCSEEGCENGRKEGGLCTRHGAKRTKCLVQGCKKLDQKGGYCRKHGTKPTLCSTEGCKNNALKEGICIKHGSSTKKKRCSEEGCENQSQKGDVCIKHGAKTKRCSKEGCENQSQKGGVCMKHGATETSKCNHNVFKYVCRTCDPIGHLSHIVRSRILSALKSKKSKRSIEYLGVDILTFKEYIKQQFSEDMSWDNYGDWEIDHIVPIKYNNPTPEEVVMRLHYLNTQPLWKHDNLSKGNRYIG